MFAASEHRRVARAYDNRDRYVVDLGHVGVERSDLDGHITDDTHYADSKQSARTLQRRLDPTLHG
jgi:hypothetical protein